MVEEKPPYNVKLGKISRLVVESNSVNKDKLWTLRVAFSRRQLDLLPQSPEDEAELWLNPLQPWLLPQGSM